MAEDKIFGDLGLDLGKPVAGADIFGEVAQPKGPFAAGLSSGFAGIRGAAGGLVALAGRGFGAKPIEDAGLNYAREQGELASAGALRVEDVNSAGTALDFTKYALGTAAPSILLTVLGGIAGRTLAGFGAKATTVAEIAAKRAALNVGTIAGAGTASFAQEAGGIFPDAVQEGVGSPITRALTGGAAAAALDLLPEAYLAHRLGLLGEAATKPLMKGFGARAAGAVKAAGVTAPLEAGTEAAQSFIERLAAGQSLNSPEAISDYINSAAVGAIAGGTLGGATGGFNPAQPQQPAAVAPEPAPVVTPPAAPAPAPEAVPPVTPPGPPPEDTFMKDVNAAIDFHQLRQGVAGPAVEDHLATLRDELAKPSDQRRPKEVIEREIAQARMTRVQKGETFAKNFDALEAEDLGKHAQESDTAWRINNATGRAEFEAVPTQMQAALKAAADKAHTPVVEPKAAAPAASKPVAPTTTDLMTLMRLNRKDDVDPADAQALTDRGLTEDRGDGSHKLTEQGYRTMQAMRRAAVQGRNPLTVTDERRAGIVQQLATEGVRENIAELSSFAGSPAAKTKLANVAPLLIEAAAQAAKLPTLAAAANELRAQATTILRGVVTNKDGAVDTFTDDLMKRVYQAPTFYNKGALDESFTARRQAQLEAEEDADTERALTEHRDFQTQQTFQAIKSEVLPWLKETRELAAKASALRGYPTGTQDVTWALGQMDVIADYVPKALDRTQPMHTPSKFDGNPDRATIARNLVENVRGLGADVSNVLRTHLQEIAAYRAQLNMRSSNARTTAARIDAVLSNVSDIQHSDAAQVAANLFTNEVLRSTGADAIAKLRVMVGDRADLKVTQYFAEPGQPVGRYVRTGPLQGMIELAYNAKDQLSAAAHEGYHFLEDAVLPANERAVIVRAMKNGTPLFQQVLARVQAYDAVNRTDLTTEVATNPAEARAYAYEFWQRGELQVSGALQTVFAKLRQFLERVRNLISGYGFTSMEDVFQAIEKGAYATAPRHESAIDGAQESNAAIAPLPPALLAEAQAVTRERYEAGDLTTAQAYDTALKLMAHADAPGPLSAAVMGPAWTQTKNFFDRTRMRWIATQNYVASRSAAFKNALNVLKTWDQRRNMIIANSSRIGLSEWHKSRPDADFAVAGKALVERTMKGVKQGDPEYANIMARLTPQQRVMFNQANVVVNDLLQRNFLADQTSYADSFSSDALLDWIRAQPIPPTDDAIKAAAQTLAHTAATQWAVDRALETGKTPTESEVVARDRVHDDFAQWYINRRAQIARLIETGYVPLRRFGQYVVRAYIPYTDKKGKEQQLTVFRDHFDREGAAISYAQKYGETMALHAPSIKVEHTILHKIDRDTSISMQEFLDAAKRNGIPLTQAEKERVAKALISAESARANRFFRREGTPGASEDMMRVLHEYIVLSASQIARSEMNPPLNAALAGAPVNTWIADNGTLEVQVDRGTNLWNIDPQNAGFYQNHLDDLVDYVMVPDHGGRWSSMWRGAAMNYFLGGSLASAAVNMLSVPMNVPSWLSQRTDIPNATAITLSTWKDVLASSIKLRDPTVLKDKTQLLPAIDKVPGLRDALIRAGEDGTTADTEIHQIMGISAGSMLAKSRKVQTVMNGWLWPFRFAENTNRLTAFISAWKVGGESGLSGRELYQYAQAAVENTQNSYAAVNRPFAAQHPVGAMLFMFKSFPLFTIEMMETLFRQRPKAAVFMLLSLVAFAGIQGLPFAETVLDLVDTISQRLFNSPFNSRRAMRNVLKDVSEMVTGIDLSEVALHGVVNEITGLNVATRVGLGDFVPGTRLGAADSDFGRVAQDMLGAPISMATDVLGAAGTVLSGITGPRAFSDALIAAARDGGPSAVRNLIKGGEQLAKNYAVDSHGRKVTEVTAPQALWQLAGFSSQSMLKAYEADRITKQTEAFYKEVSDQLSGELVKGVREGNTQKVADVYSLMQKWNESNPTMPMVITPSAIRRRIQDAGITLHERTQKHLPRALRGQSTGNE